MSVPNTPIVNAGLKYVNGLQLSNSATTPNSQLAIAAGQARDSTNSNDIILSEAAVINGLAVGAGGVDQAVLAVNSLYAVYVIASSKSVFTPNDQLAGRNPSGPDAPPNPFPVVGMLSLAANAAPYLPFGYDMWRRIGWVSTDNAANLVKFWQYGANEQRKYYWDLGASVLAAGASATFASVPMAVALTLGAGIPSVPVPPLALEVLLDVSLAGAATLQFRPYGSAAAQGDVRLSAAGAIINSMLVPSQLNAGVPTVQYAVSASSVSLLVTGFVDLL
jgi:hypothetical protein